MTVDEIFTSESEHLYFRLIAARNALNAANDSDTIQVLNDILDETLNNIDRIGTDEEIAAAEEIVVRKSNKTVKDYLSSQKFALIATAVMFTAAVGAALALLIIILGGGDISKMIKPIITVVIIAGGIIAMAFFVAKYMKKRMNTACEQLNGRTVIGCRINTGAKSTRPASSSTTSTSSSSAATTTKQRESRPASHTKTKVYRNYFGVIKVVLILGVIAVLGFLAFSKRNEIVDGAKTIMFNIGLYDPAGDANSEKFAEIRNTLINKRKGICYNEAERLFSEEKFFEAAEMYNNSYGYNNEIDEKIRIANNCGYYVNAEELVKTSMYKARVELNKIKLPFSGFKIGGKGTKNVDLILKQYTRYLDFTGIYGSGDDVFNIMDFIVKNNAVYIIENKLGEMKISTDIDREGYEYKVEKKNGEEVTEWYIATDHVLKVTAEGEKRLKK